MSRQMGLPCQYSLTFKPHAGVSNRKVTGRSKIIYSNKHLRQPIENWNTGVVLSTGAMGSAQQIRWSRTCPWN